MKTAIVTALALSTAAFSQDVVITAVEPDWGIDPDTPTITYPVSVLMTVDADGVPFAIEAERALPLSLVSALAKYQMRKLQSAYSVRIPVSVKVPVEQYPYGGIGGGANVVAFQVAAEKLDAEKAAVIEGKLKDDDKSVNERSVLVMWSVREATPASFRMRARQVAWLVEHAPAAEVLRDPSAWINGAEGPGFDSEGYIQVRDLWLEHSKTTPLNSKTLEAAAMLLRFVDPLESERALRAGGSAMFAATPRLGELYAWSVIGIRAVNPVTGVPAVSGPEFPNTAFAARAKASLLSATDPRLLFGAVHALRVALGSSAPQGTDEFCEEVRRQLVAVVPASKETCDPIGAPTVREPGSVSAARITRQGRPQYPEDARRRGIQGKVMFMGIIGKDGRIKDLEIIQGPFVLIDSALAAVRRWEYKPTTIDGEPVEAVTELEVNYTLN